MLHIGHQREELDIELEGKILNQRDSFVYLDGAVCGDGKTERDIRRRVVVVVVVEFISTVQHIYMYT